MTTQYLVYDGGTCLGLFVIDDAAADHLRNLGFRLGPGEYAVMPAASLFAFSLPMILK